MEALADAAADDPEVELAYRGALDFFIEATAQPHRGRDRRRQHPALRRRGDRAGAVHHERPLHASVLGRNPTVDPDVVVDTLTTIWVRTLYGESA